MTRRLALGTGCRMYSSIVDQSRQLEKQVGRVRLLAASLMTIRRGRRIGHRRVLALHAQKMVALGCGPEELPETAGAVLLEELRRYQPCCVCWATPWKLVIAWLVRTCCCASSCREGCRSFAFAVARV